MNPTKTLLAAAFCIALGSAPDALAIPPLLPFAVGYIITTHLPAKATPTNPACKTLKMSDLCNEDPSEEELKKTNEIVQRFQEIKNDETKALIKMFDTAYNNAWNGPEGEKLLTYGADKKISWLDTLNMTTLVYTLEVCYHLDDATSNKYTILEKRRYPMPKLYKKPTQDAYNAQILALIKNYQKQTVEKIENCLKAGKDPVTAYLPSKGSRPQLIED